MAENDLNYLEVIQGMKKEASHPDTIEAVAKLFRQRDEFLQLLDEPYSDRKSRAIKTNIARIEERLTEIDGAAFVGAAAETLALFDIESLDDDAVTHYMLRVQQFHSTGNGHLVLEVFSQCVIRGINPPKWVMEYVAFAFAKYVFPGPRQETSVLLKDLGLVGEASGATSPRSIKNAMDEGFGPMMDMASLIKWHNLSQNDAARCVIIKYGLKYSESTAKRKFKAHFGFIRHGMSSPLTKADLGSRSEVERTKFFDSFPPKAKTIIRTGSS